MAENFIFFLSRLLAIRCAPHILVSRRLRIMVSISGVIFILASLDGRLDLSDNSDLPSSFSRFIQRYNVERAIPHRRAVFVTEPVSAYSSSHFWRIRIFRISSFMLRRYGLRFAYEKKKCSVSIDTLHIKPISKAFFLYARVPLNVLLNVPLSTILTNLYLKSTILESQIIHDFLSLHIPLKI